MRITQTTPGPPEPFSTKVNAVAGLRIDFGTNKGTYIAHEPIVLAATLADTQPILGATVNASIKRPDGSTVTLPLFDDGTHLDGTSGDGIYATTFSDTVQVGSYSINFSATGVSNKGEHFTRTGQAAVVVEANPAPPADLFIIQTGPSESRVGATLAYSITYGNNGPGNAVDVAITDLFPQGTTYVADSLGGGVDVYGAGRSWIIGSLAAGSRNTLTLSVSVPATATVGTLITNTVSIFIHPSGAATRAAPDPNFDNNVSIIPTRVTGAPPLPPRAAAPTLSEWAMIVLTTLSGLVLTAGVTRRRPNRG